MTTGDDNTTNGGGDDVPNLRLVRQDGKPVEGEPRRVRGRRNQGKQDNDTDTGEGARSRSQKANTRRLSEYLLDNGWSEQIRFNMLAEQIEVRSPPWLVCGFVLDGVVPGSWRVLHDADLLEATVLLHETFPSVGVEGVLEALRLIAHRRAVHPVRDYLAALVWDGVPRLHKLFSHYFNAELPAGPERATHIRLSGTNRGLLWCRRCRQGPRTWLQARQLRCDGRQPEPWQEQRDQGALPVPGALHR
jgi:predicted P-loop ATPase